MPNKENVSKERREQVRAATLAAVKRMQELGGRTTFTDIRMDVETAIPGVDFREIDRALQWLRGDGKLTHGRAGWRLVVAAAMLLLVMIAGCVDDASSTSTTANTAVRDIDQACGAAPWQEPSWVLTSYPGTTGQVCMPDASYIARDKFAQQVRDWVTCAEITACRNRGECQ